MEQKFIRLINKLLGKHFTIEESLHGGMMNEAYIILNNGEKYVLYLPTAQANEMVDRNIEKEAQNIAENLKITRKTLCFNTLTGMKLCSFIEGKSLNNVEKIDFSEVAKLLFKFHSSKDKSSKDYLPLIRLEEYKNEALNFTDLSDDFYDLFEIVLSNKEYLESQEKTLAHNDAQRSNIILGDDGLYYLIDYEFAMNNDPIYDIATFGNDDVNDGLKLLEEYKKLTIVNDAEKRYALWRIDISLQWYLVALIKHYRGEGKTHNIDFLMVADHFIKNALDAKKLLK